MLAVDVLGPHAGFIIAAYLVTAAVVLSLIGWVVADQRIQRRRLAELESRGSPRRQPVTAPSRSAEELA